LGGNRPRKDWEGGIDWRRRAPAVFLGEAKRSQRTGRSFALLLLRLDELKQINEQAGLAGRSRTLCKLASILGELCRTADAPARNSEDDFVIVLPEASTAGARRLIQRIAERTNNQADALLLAISKGIAQFPQDGPTFEYVLRSAKRALKKIESTTTKEFVHSA
jgi:c-di-GMP-specific phosphodiesterase